MTDPSHFQVDVAQLRTHSDTVGTIASGLSDAVNGTALSANALGSFVQFLADALTDAATRTNNAIATAASTMDGVRAGLAQTADRYQNTDQHNATNLSGIEA